MKPSAYVFHGITWALQSAGIKKGRADIYFSRSVGKDIPARPTLLVVYRDCMPIPVWCRYVLGQFRQEIP